MFANCLGTSSHTLFADLIVIENGILTLRFVVRIFAIAVAFVANWRHALERRGANPERTAFS
jgi:hypothetical protein